MADLCQPNRAACLRNVHKNYGDAGTLVRALDGVDLEVPQGELLLLVGPSGCGKTTLLSVLCGILDATSGEVEVFHTRIDRLTQEQKTAFRRENIGFIFQQYNLLPSLTAAENVAVPLLIHEVPWLQAVARARETLAQVGMADRTEFLPAKLSGGQQQRVAIARAMVTQPRLIVCDEPTAALDGATGQMVLQVFREQVLTPERAIVIVTHDSRIFHFGDRIADMRDGRILGVHSQHEHVALELQALQKAGQP
ncbi:MAG TPA: ABC transporter ATP-binding protein [Acidobacteriaceae bacterium]|jgi:putative ABC transport system ATP-binding protein|nr:ABC transporter ATP-binding protein [Acidobacteriaceae bacterium]